LKGDPTDFRLAQESSEHTASPNEDCFAIAKVFMTSSKTIIIINRIVGIIKSKSVLTLEGLRKNTSLERHALPQLPLPLPSLQLQPTNSIAQPLLLLPQLAHLQLLQIAQTTRR
jgi:hypothetical protein